VLVATLALLAGLVLAPAASAAPNVIVFVTDDQRLDGTMQVMPKTTKWFHTGGDLGGGAGTVSGGTFFPNAVANTPWCCPARSSIFTGKYAHNHGVENLEGTKLGQSESSPMQQKTLQAYLKAANPSYRTALFGKYLNGWGLDCRTPAPPASPPPAPPPPPFFDDYAMFEGSSHSPSCKIEDEVPGQSQTWQYAEHYVRNKTLQFLDEVENSPSNEPFFLYVAPAAPHSPNLPETKYQDAAVPDLPETAAFFEADRTDKPEWVRRELVHDAATLRSDWKDQLRMLKSVDDTVDAVMRKVRDMGQDNNTIAFFTSDNGFMWGDHGMTSKARPYRSSVSVPFYMRWPGWAGHSGNETDERLVAHVDIAPTVLAAAGVTPGDAKDGRNLISTANPRKHIFMEQNGEDLESPSWLSILTPTYRYIETYAEPNQLTDYSQIESREYYDLTRDPQEVTNLLGDRDPLNDPPTAGLSAQLAADRACAGATCPPNNGEPPLEVEITGKADGSTTPSFHFTSSEPGSAFECWLEGPFIAPAWKECHNPYSYPNSLVNGDYTFKVRARKPGPVYSNVKSYTWNIAASVPDTSFSFTPAKRSSSQTAWFGFTSTHQPDLFQCRLNGGMWQACASPYSIAVPDTPESDPHKLEVRSFDSTLTPDPTPATFEWSVDSTPMQIAGFVATTRSYERDAMFEFSASEKPESAEPPGEEKQTKFECMLDDGAWDPCRSPKRYSGLSSAQHTFRVRVSDVAGNVSSVREHQWDIGSVQAYRSLPDTSWPAVTAGDEIRTVIPDGCGGWYAGGTFSAVGGVGADNIVHIKADKTVDTSWTPEISKTADEASVRTLLLRGGLLYIGGTFSRVGVTPRNNLAAVTPANCNGSAADSVTAWNPGPNNTVYGLASRAAAPTTLYAVGAFSNFTQGAIATTRRKVAEIETAGTGAVTAWNPDANSGATLLAVAAAPTGVYVGGNGLTTIGGAARTNLAELDRVTGAATSWDPSPDGGVNSIYWRRTAVADWIRSPEQLPTVLVAGGFSQIGRPLPGTGQPTRLKVAELGATDEGYVTTWDPSLTAGSAAYDIVPLTTTSTIVAGAFTEVGTVARARLAQTDRATGAVQDWSPEPDPAVFKLAYEFSADDPPPRLAAAGSFGNVGSPAQQRRMIAVYCRIDLPQNC
jgi:arylsulfatase A-like enzyme